MNGQEYLITMHVPVSLEEPIVDCLLSLEADHGFCSMFVNAHDHRKTGFSLAEQVSGRQKKIRFQMYIDDKDLALLLEKLRAQFTGAGIRYWVTPVIEHGIL